MTLLDKIGELAATVNAAEDDIFQAFCRKIKVSNIREYEERQMKVAQEESKARLLYETQISRFTHQFSVSIYISYRIVNCGSSGLSSNRRV
jgi:structural maintenance of chromosome 1